jgi:hypothetical protein
MVSVHGVPMVFSRSTNATSGALSRKIFIDLTSELGFRAIYIVVLLSKILVRQRFQLFNTPLNTYQKCFPEGISQTKMSNIIGWAGEETSRSGDTVIYKWASGDKGTLTATFVKDTLASKSQNGLK